jgi:arylsulfatase A-like enzyme
VSVGDQTVFTGSAKFNVTAGNATSVEIHLTGSSQSANGAVSVGATFSTSPVIDELTATPTTVFVGGHVTLTGLAHDPDGAPSALSYYWSTTGGLIDNPIAPSATLTSDTPGTFTVELTVSDGENTTTKSVPIQFVREETAGGGGNAGPQRPNILFIIADDLGAESVSLYPDLVGDSGAVPIPNLEALAEDGLVFDNAWASPVCSPTRGTILSGLYGHKTGVTTVGNVLPTSTVTLFDRLSADSPTYEHALFGKYHVGGGNSASVDPLPGGAYPQAPGILQHVRDLGITTFRGILAGGINDYFNWTTWDINAPEATTTTFATTALTDYAIDFIHEHEEGKPDEPWFVYQSYNAPHAIIGGGAPFQVPPSELHSVEIPGNPAPGTVATSIPVYKALVQSLDTEIGRLLAEVDLEKTTVIFVGDNGTPGGVKDTGTGVRASKGGVYEGGVRVPLVIAGAGVTRQGREDDLFVVSDIYASVLDLAGVPTSHVNNSYSVKPLLSDEAATNGRTHSFTEVSSGTSNRSYAVRDKRFKLVAISQQRALYDLVADPLETTNLYTNPAYAAVRATLLAEIAELRAETPAYFP